MFNYVVVWFLECILFLKELDVCYDPSKTEIETKVGNSISTKGIFVIPILAVTEMYNGKNRDLSEVVPGVTENKGVRSFPQRPE